MRDSRPTSGDPVCDKGFALVKGFYWAGYVKCSSLPVYTAKYPDGQSMGAYFNVGEYAGEVFDISASDDGAYLCGFLPHMGGGSIFGAAGMRKALLQRKGYGSSTSDST